MGDDVEIVHIQTKDWKFGQGADFGEKKICVPIKTFGAYSDMLKLLWEIKIVSGADRQVLAVADFDNVAFIDGFIVDQA